MFRFSILNQYKKLAPVPSRFCNVIVLVVIWSLRFLWRSLFEISLWKFGVVARRRNSFAPFLPLHLIQKAFLTIPLSLTKVFQLRCRKLQVGFSFISALGSEVWAQGSQHNHITSPEYPNKLGHRWRHETHVSTNENACFSWSVGFHNKPRDSRWRTKRVANAFQCHECTSSGGIHLSRIELNTVATMK